MELASAGFLLGLATGVFCLGACAPALIGLLLAEGGGWRRGLRVVAEVSAGRVIAYLCFGAIAGGLGTAIEGAGPDARRLEGAATIALAVLLALYLVRPKAWALPLRPCHWAVGRAANLPVALGFLTGLSLCPPFLLAMATALSAGGPLQGMIYFTAFFAGTSFYLLPLVPLSSAGRWEAPRLVGRMAGALAACAFLAVGLGQLVA